MVLLFRLTFLVMRVAVVAVAVAVTAPARAVVAAMFVVERARFDVDVVKESIGKAEWRQVTALDRGGPYLNRLAA